MAKKSRKTRREVLIDDIPLIVLSNEPSPMKVNVLQVFYQAAEVAQLAYADGKDPETGEIVPLIVGLEPTTAGKFKVWPLARVISKGSEIKQYLMPDGKGGYFDGKSAVSAET